MYVFLTNVRQIHSYSYLIKRLRVATSFVQLLNEMSDNIRHVLVSKLIELTMTCFSLISKYSFEKSAKYLKL